MRKIAIVVVLLIVSLSAPLLYGADICNDVVYDGARVFGSKTSTVEDAAGKLINLGTDVHVVTVPTLGGAETIEAWQKNLEKKCSSWQTPDGMSRKNNLVILAVATKSRKSGVFYGGEWRPSLGADSNWSRVRTDFMNPRFRDGDWAGGVINGLNEIHRLLDLQIHPPAPFSGSKTVIVDNRPPTDFSGLWAVLKWILAIFVFGALVWMGWFLYNVRAKRRAAQQNAKLAKQGAASRVNALSDELNLLGLKVKSAAAKFVLEDVEVVNQKLLSINSQFDLAASDYSGLGRSANDPDRPGLTEEEYNATTTGYAELVEKLIQVSQLKSEIEHDLTELENLPKKIEKAITNSGDRVDLAKKRVFEAKDVFDKISEKYAKTSWESVRGNGTEAMNRIGLMLKILEDARAAAETKNWSKARDLLKQIDGGLSEAESLLKSIFERAGNLTLAEKDAPKEIAATKRDVVKARKFIEANAEDIEDKFERGAFADLERAEELLKDLSDKLEESKPDFPQVLQCAKEAHDCADKILANAQGEHEAMERLREKEASVMRDAERAISKATEYIEDHKNDVDKTSKEYLEEAEEYLKKAKKASDLKTRIDYLEEAQAKGNKSYDKAKEKVHKANDNSDRSWGRGSPSNNSIFVFTGHPESKSDGGGGYSGGGSGSDWGSSSDSGGGGGGWSSDSGGGGGGDFGGSDSGGGGGGDF